MVREHSKNGALQLLSENLSRVRAMKPEQLGFPEGTRLPFLLRFNKNRLILDYRIQE